MHLQNRLLTKHHRARLVAWTLVMLAWLAQVLFKGATFTLRHERQRAQLMSLGRLTWQVTHLIVSRAGELAGQRRPKRVVTRRYGQALLRSGLMRAVIGSRLHKALRRKSFAARIAALIDALKRLDHWAGLVARRLRRRITKLWPTLPAPEATAPLAMFAAPPAFLADSS